MSPHAELRVPDLTGALGPWDGLLDEIGWAPLFPDHHPHTGGADSYAAHSDDA